MLILYEGTRIITLKVMVAFLLLRSGE